MSPHSDLGRLTRRVGFHSRLVAPVIPKSFTKSSRAPPVGLCPRSAPPPAGQGRDNVTWDRSCLGGQQEFPRGRLSADILSWVESGDLATDGQRLLEALLADGASRDTWNKACSQAPRRHVRLRIDPNTAELYMLPWELLQDDSTMLSVQADTRFSRYLPIAFPWSGMQVGNGNLIGLI